MDVESAMKVNELAKELSKKGFASSSEEASKMAEQYLQKNIIPKSNLEKGSDKFEIQLERIQRKFNSELSCMQEKMNSMIQKLNIVCDEIKNLKSQAIEPKQKELPKQNTDSNSNQRVGNFKPGDIDINEVFYCGAK